MKAAWVMTKEEWIRIMNLQTQRCADDLERTGAFTDCSKTELEKAAIASGPAADVDLMTIKALHVARRAVVHKDKELAIKVFTAAKQRLPGDDAAMIEAYLARHMSGKDHDENEADRAEEILRHSIVP